MWRKPWQRRGASTSDGLDGAFGQYRCYGSLLHVDLGAFGNCHGHELAVIAHLGNATQYTATDDHVVTLGEDGSQLTMVMRPLGVSAPQKAIEDGDAADQHKAMPHS